MSNKHLKSYKKHTILMHTERVHESIGESQFHSNCCQGPGDQTWTTSLAGLLHQGYSVSCWCCSVFVREFSSSVIFLSIKAYQMITAQILGMIIDLRGEWHPLLCSWSLRQHSSQRATNIMSEVLALIIDFVFIFNSMIKLLTELNDPCLVHFV